MVDVEDAQETASKEGEDEGGKEDEKNDDKTLGKKITSLDVLNGCKISSLNFSDDDGYVVVNYVKGNGTRFKVYQSGGSIVSLELDDILQKRNIILFMKEYRITI